MDLAGFEGSDHCWRGFCIFLQVFLPLCPHELANNQKKSILLLNIHCSVIKSFSIQHKIECCTYDPFLQQGM